MNKSIIVFDGECGICSILVKTTYWLSIKSNKKNLYYTPLSSELGLHFSEKVSINNSNLLKNDTMIFYHEKIIYSGSTALIKAYAFSSGFSSLNILLLIPRKFRDLIYQLISKNRYKLTNFFKLSSASSCDLYSKSMIGNRILNKLSEIR